MNSEECHRTLEITTNIAKMNQIANKDLGITQEYNKVNREKLWDSAKGKSDFKDKTFGDKATYEDPVSGKILHKSQKAAQNKYHMKNNEGENVSSKWAEHSAETDHINALKDVHDAAKHNPFLSDADFKEIINSDENYRILSKSDNASKGEKSDWKVITEKDREISKQGKVQIAKEKVFSDIALQKKFTIRTAQKAGKEFVEGATDTLVKTTIPLTVEAVRQIIRVSEGEECVDDVAKEIGKTTINTAIEGGANKLLVDSVTTNMANSNNTVLKNIANSNEMGKIITVASIVQKAAVKYVNGEIDEKEFLEGVGEEGTAIVTGMIGGQIGREIGEIIGGVAGTTTSFGLGTAVGAVTGGVIGEVLGTIITTAACSAIVSVLYTSKHINDYKLKEEQIRELESVAIKEIKEQRNNFKSIVEREGRHWDEEIQKGFDLMLCSACEETFDLQGVTEGLDKILGVFGKSITFNSVDEYEAQLDKTLKLSF